MEFPQGTDKSVFLEKAYFMDLIMSQIKHKLRKLLTMAGAGCKIEEQASFNLTNLACVRVHLLKKNQQNVGCIASLIILSIQFETWFFFFTILILKLVGLRATADPKGSNILNPLYCNIF